MSIDQVIHLDQVRDIPIPPDIDIPATDEHDHTWRPLNIVELAANPPEPPTIGGLLYPGKRHVLSGETESMKTWLALILTKAELDIGAPVGWVDLDAMGPGAILERLQLLGVDEATIARDFLYYDPSESLGPQMLDEITDTIRERGIRLFVIDAFNPMLTLHSLDPEKGTQVETFWRTYADPICRAGAAAVLLDHVVKNSENRGKYSLGSERKASGVDGCHIGFKLLDPLSKGGTGRSLLITHKDRPGYLPRPAVGQLILTSHDDRIEYELAPDRSHDPESGGFRPTNLMEKVSRYLEMQPDEVSGNQVENGVNGKAQYLRDALLALYDGGYITVKAGPRRSNLYTSIRPYREADDDTPTTSSPLRPDFVLDLGSRRLRPSSPSLRGTRTNVDLVPGRTPPRPGHHTADLNNGDPIHEYDRPPIDETLIPYDLDMGDLHHRLANAQPDHYQEDT